MKRLIPVALMTVCIAAGSLPVAANPPPRKIDSAALEQVRLAPMPRAKAAAGNPLRPRMREPQPVTTVVETRAHFTADGSAVLACDQIDAHDHPQVGDQAEPRP